MLKPILTSNSSYILHYLNVLFDLAILLRTNSYNLITKNSIMSFMRDIRSHYAVY